MVKKRLRCILDHFSYKIPLTAEKNAIDSTTKAPPKRRREEEIESQVHIVSRRTTVYLSRADVHAELAVTVCIVPLNSRNVSIPDIVQKVCNVYDQVRPEEWIQEVRVLHEKKLIPTGSAGEPLDEGQMERYLPTSRIMLDLDVVTLARSLLHPATSMRGAQIIERVNAEKGTVLERNWPTEIHNLDQAGLIPVTLPENLRSSTPERRAQLEQHKVERERKLERRKLRLERRLENVQHQLAQFEVIGQLETAVEAPRRVINGEQALSSDGHPGMEALILSSDEEDEEGEQMPEEKMYRPETWERKVPRR